MYYIGQHKHSQHTNTATSPTDYTHRQRFSPLATPPTPSSALQQLIGGLLQSIARCHQRLAAHTKQDPGISRALLVSQFTHVLTLVGRHVTAHPRAIDWAWELYVHQLQPFVCLTWSEGDVEGREVLKEVWGGLPWGGARFFCRTPRDLDDFGMGLFVVCFESGVVMRVVCGVYIGYVCEWKTQHCDYYA